MSSVGVLASHLEMQRIGPSHKQTKKIDSMSHRSNHFTLFPHCTSKSNLKPISPVPTSDPWDEILPRSYEFPDLAHKIKFFSVSFSPKQCCFPPLMCPILHHSWRHMLGLEAPLLTLGAQWVGAGSRCRCPLCTGTVTVRVSPC